MGHYDSCREAAEEVQWERDNKSRINSIKRVMWNSFKEIVKEIESIENGSSFYENYEFNDIEMTVVFYPAQPEKKTIKL